MSYLHRSVFFALALVIFASCSGNSNQPWTKAIPENTPFIIVPAEDAQLDSTLISGYSSFLSELSSDSTDLIVKIDSTISAPIKLHAITLRPGAQQKLSALWITQAPAGASSALKKAFYRDFVQNSYQFGDQEIQRLHINDRIFFTSHISDLFLLSESSLAIEEAIRAYSGDAARANLAGLSIQPDHLILNTPALDSGLRQLAQVKYHPAIKGAFAGTTPALISFRKNEDEFQFSGRIPLADDEPEGALTKAISDSNAAITLDRYVSSNAAGFGFFRQAPPATFSDSLPDTSRTDSRLMQDQELYSSIAQNIAHRFALVLYAESGFMTEGEQLYLRELSDAEGFKAALATLEEEKLITREEESYYIQSRIVGSLLGGSINTLSGFYLKVSDNVAILSERKELTEMVISDKDRRRTMYYEQQFRQVKASLPEKVSSLFVTTDNFSSYIEPSIIPESYAPALLSKFQMLTISTTLDEDHTGLDLQLTNHSSKKKVSPTRSSGSIQPNPSSPASRP